MNLLIEEYLWLFSNIRDIKDKFIHDIFIHGKRKRLSYVSMRNNNRLYSVNNIRKNEIHLYITASLLICMSNETLNELTAEVKMIRSLLERLSRDMLKHDLEAVATTKDRRIIWTYLDGLNSTDEISKKTEVSQRTVQLFVKELLDADLVIIEKRGYPRRKIDYIPSSWRVENNGG
jgi:hypothetical protein